jgi:hypothetical protein
MLHRLKVSPNPVHAAHSKGTDEIQAFAVLGQHRVKLPLEARRIPLALH